jgi:GntR family transcriptional regulator of vanillate catabolism
MNVEPQLKTPIASSAKPDLSDDGASQVVKAQLKLRQMVLSGELAAGSRIVELVIVEKLGVSRTPIRTALMRLEQEGLLEALPNGGFAVRTFTERDVSDAIASRLA